MLSEISGVAKIYNPQFFNELQQQTAIDLENIVYYKNDTHYFVMTAKKQSLLDKNVIRQDFPDAARLLARDNVNFTQLCNFACEAAQFATKCSNQFTFEFAVSVEQIGKAEEVGQWTLFDFDSFRKIIMVLLMFKCSILHLYFMLSMPHALLNDMENKF